MVPAPPRRTSRPFERPVSRSLAALTLVACLLPGVVAPVRAASLRPDGRLEIGGAPIFPVGLVELGTYKYADWAERIHDCGANFVWDIEIAYADTIPSCSDVLREAEQGGWYLLVGSGDTWNWDDPGTPQHEVDKRMYEPGGLAALLDCASAYPDRLVAFANRDEPSWTISRNMIWDIDATHIHETYTQLHDAAPQTVVAMNHAPAQVDSSLAHWKDDVRSFATATDVMMFASYPYPAGVGTCGAVNVLGYPECKMDRLAVAADLFLSELNQPGQPLWMIVQAHKGIPLKEARWEAWASIVHGATGVFWAGWTWYHDLGSGEENWPITKQVISEVSGLQPFLVGTDLPGAECDVPDIDVRALRGPRNDVILIAIARNGFSGPASLRLPALARGDATVLFEDRTLHPVDGRITDSFDGYEAHVYRYRARFGERFGADRDGGATDPEAEVAGRPAILRLGASPNPTMGESRVRFDVPRPASVLFSVFDAGGRRVATLGRGTYDAGAGEILWDGRDASGRPVPAGVYFVRASSSDGETATARVLVRR